MLDDPEWGWEHAVELMEGGSPRYLDDEKSWRAIGFAMRRADVPMDFLTGGGECIPGAADWDILPPRHLTVAQVRQASDALAAADVDALVDALDPAELARANVHPQIWDEPDALDHVRRHVHALAGFLAAAARDGDAVVLWLSCYGEPVAP